MASAAPFYIEVDMKKLLNADPITGKKTYFHGEADGNYVSTEQPVDNILDAAKYEANDWRYGDLMCNTQKHKQKVGEIPAVIYYDLLKKFGQPRENPKAWLKWLEENKGFKATGGKLI